MDFLMNLIQLGLDAGILALCCEVVFRQKEEIKAAKPIKDKIQEKSQRSGLAKAKPIKKQPKAGMIINDRVIK